MPNPINDLLALRRAPAALAADLSVITDTMRSVRAIETMLASVLASLAPLLTDVERLRKTVEPQQKRVAHLEQMMQTLEQRTTVIETTLLGLASDVRKRCRPYPIPRTTAARSPKPKTRSPEAESGRCRNDFMVPVPARRFNPGSR